MAQQEYTLAYSLTFAFLLLGMLVVCIPRPRKSKVMDPKEAAKEKKIRDRDKAKAKRKKIGDKKKKKANKARAKAQKKKSD